MILEVYRNTAEPNRVDKTDYLTRIKRISGEQLPIGTDIAAPIVVISDTDGPAYNYAYIGSPYFRYYYIDKIEWAGENLWRLFLRCDVLMTYKTQIGELSAIVARQENIFNNMLADDRVTVSTEPEVAILESTAANPFTPSQTAQQLDCRYLMITAEGVTV